MDTGTLKSSDVLTETVISLPQTSRRLPPSRLERPVSPVTIWRWIVEGIRLPDGSRLKLEAVRLGGRWVTSVEALSRFAARQTPLPLAHRAGTQITPEGARDGARMEAELRKRGI